MPQIVSDSAQADLNARLIVRFFREVLMTGDAARAGGFLAEDFIDHDAAPSLSAGADAVIQKLAVWWHAFPDGQFALETVIAAGDLVAARSTFTGTHLGPFGPIAPAGRRVSVSFSDWYRVGGGRIVAHWHNFDEAGLMRQLGASAAR